MAASSEGRGEKRPADAGSAGDAAESLAEAKRRALADFKKAALARLQEEIEPAEAAQSPLAAEEEEKAEDEAEEEEPEPDLTPYDSEVHAADMDIMSFLKNQADGAVGKVLDAQDEIACRGDGGFMGATAGVIGRSQAKVVRKVSRATLLKGALPPGLRRSPTASPSPPADGSTGGGEEPVEEEAEEERYGEVFFPQADRSATHDFVVGQKVQRRRNGKAWDTGFVTSVRPLKITVIDDANADGFDSWDEVRALPEEVKSGKAKPAPKPKKPAGAVSKAPPAKPKAGAASTKPKPYLGPRIW